MAIVANPTVNQANTTLRARANDAAWWLDHWAKALDEGRSMPSDPESMRKTATGLRAAVNACNGALDQEAFAPIREVPHAQELGKPGNQMRES